MTTSHSTPIIPELVPEPQELVRRRERGSTKVARARKVADLAQKFEDMALSKERTEALVFARTLALAGLPKRRSKERDISRTLRLGTELWVRVTYSAAKDNELPFGEDRLVIAAVQHLAIANNSREVFFRRVSDILRMFNRTANSQNLRLLRARFLRIAGLSISIRMARTEAELMSPSAGDQLFIFRQFNLPTRDQVMAAQSGSDAPLLPFFPETAEYGVLLDEGLWEHLQDPSNRFIVPIELLSHFCDRPVAYDYMLFVMHRCASAKRESCVPGEVLLQLFRDSPRDTDRRIFRRLLGYHKELMLATGGKLNATLVKVGTKPTGERGRPADRWVLRVGPSRSLVNSGAGRRLSLPAPKTG